MSEKTYEKSLERLEIILSELEEGKTGVDKLSDLVHEAAELIKFCKGKLKSTEEDIQKAFEES